MTDPQEPHVLPLSLETLEPREVPAGTPWVVESFQHSAANGLPQGWTQWSSDKTAGFSVDTVNAGLGDQGRLVSNANSDVNGRAWLSAPFAADVETSAAVYLNTTVPVQLFVRGYGLNTATPSYYAVNVVRGAEVQLVKVVDGKTTVLGRVKTPDYISNRWAMITIKADGDKLRVSFHLGDTNQFLGSDGKWTRQPTAAIEVTDRSIKGAGNVGFSRGGQSAGQIAIDSLRVGPANVPQATPITEERFSHPAIGLPRGWSQWTQAGAATFNTVADETLRLDAGSATEARAWLNKSIPADAQISTSIYVDSLIPAGVFARGSNANTTRETYYSLTVSRGLEVKLSRVVNGVSTVIATIRSKEWLSGLWVQASLVLNGDQLRVQIYRSDTGQYLNADGTWGLAPSWAMKQRDNVIRSGGTVGLERGTGYAGQLVFDNFIVTTAPDRASAPGTIPTEADKLSTVKPPGEDLPGTTVPPTVPIVPPPAPTPTNPALPIVKRNYSWIRLANLAYYGTPLDTATQSLLRNSVDLVIPNLTYLDDIAAINPSTPQFVYTNVSNIYLGLITDWNAYADQNRVDREAAFYHVNKATTYNGMSASAVPVNRFWGIYRGTDTSWENLTRDSQHTGNSITFADRGSSVAVGYVEKFRELNVDIQTAAGSGWTSQLEYVSAVDSQGRPTRWSTLNTLTDTTNGMKRDGQLTFDPPRDWVPATISGSAKLYYVRVKTTGAGTAPSVTTILGREYTKGSAIPAFDAQADTDHDGYLNNAEYAKRRSGYDARFVYESRLFYPNYGPMRFATNVSDANFRNWAADYHVRFLASQPLATGFFVDNSVGRLSVDTTGVRESLDSYSTDYGSLLGSINKKLMSKGKWLIANTAGGNTTAEPIIQNGVSYLEEFALRPMSANHVQYDDLAATLAYRRQISGGKAYEILDSLPTGSIDANDPRMQLATLAMYYSLADANLSYLMVNGGNEPASSWKRHYIDAITFDIGKPRTTQSQFATGTDPANSALTYKVYQRDYANALVLYKPVSYTRGQTGTTNDNTGTTHRLDGWYRPVRADGSLGQPVRQVTLRNGEGAILAKVA